MGKNRRVSLSEYKQKKREENSIEIEADDGQVFVVDPPTLWSDDVMASANAGDMAALGRALLPDTYDAFVAAGGSGTIIAAIVGEELGMSVGESPASQTSSTVTEMLSRPTSSNVTDSTSSASEADDSPGPDLPDS